jgi:hypothetical protein
VLPPFVRWCYLHGQLAVVLFERARGGGGGYRQSAYASVPCYLCVAFALTVSKVLT